MVKLKYGRKKIRVAKYFNEQLCKCVFNTIFASNTLFMALILVYNVRVVSVVAAAEAVELVKM